MTMETILKFFGIQRATPQNRSWCILNYGSVDAVRPAAKHQRAKLKNLNKPVLRSSPAEQTTAQQVVEREQDK